jgi:peptidoglycan hydrolase-like protein with peptidoglycan-binding domain
LTKAGFDTGGTDGRVGNDTMKAVKDYQTKMGLLPADGYGGLKVLARLRQGNQFPVTRSVSNLTPSFRDGPKDQTRNLEIPGSMLCIAPE